MLFFYQWKYHYRYLYLLLQDILEKGDSRLSNNYGPSITTKQLVLFVYYTDTRY